MLFDPWPRYAPSAYWTRPAREPWEIEAAHALRRRVFCEEQALFEESDLDPVDARAIPIVTVSSLGGGPDEVVGTVRIDERSPGLWWGSRLAVDAAHRRVGRLGACLIRVAVCEAHARGALRFFAHVQAANARFFERMHFTRQGELDLHGEPHVSMEADLDAYPPRGLERSWSGVLTRSRKVAA